MTERISLVEAYDNRDVIARLVRQQSDIDMMMNILQNIDPDGDLTNVVLRTGDQSIAGVKTFTGKIVADCDIIQNGAAYETHAEQIYSHNDYLVMRDGQLNGLPAGSYSGLQVKKYNGSDDVRMVVDNTGIMRVGDINDEKPLMVRDEAADLTDGHIVLWDGTNQKAITAGVGTGDLIHGSGNIGDDTHPVKIVGGEPVAIPNLPFKNVFDCNGKTSGEIAAFLASVHSVVYFEIFQFSNPYYFVGILWNPDSSSYPSAWGMVVDRGVYKQAFYAQIVGGGITLAVYQAGIGESSVSINMNLVKIYY